MNISFFRKFVLLFILCGNFICFSQTLKPYENEFFRMENSVVVHSFLDIINAETTEKIFACKKQASALNGKSKWLLFQLLSNEIFFENTELFFVWKESNTDHSFHQKLEKTSVRVAWCLENIFKIPFLWDNIKSEGDLKSVLLSKICFKKLEFLAWLEQQKQQSERQIISLLNQLSIDEKIALTKQSFSSILFTALAKDHNREVRLAVLKSPYCPLNLPTLLLNDLDPEIAQLAKKEFKTTKISSKQPNLEKSIFSVKSLRPEEQRTLITWLAEHLSDLRYAPCPGSDVPDAEHDLSRIGGKCAFLLEQLFSIKLLPVNQHTPLQELEHQKEQILKQLHQKRLEIPAAETI